MNMLEVYIEKKKIYTLFNNSDTLLWQAVQKVQLKKVNRNYRETTLTFYIMDRFSANNNGMLGGEMLL